MREKGENPEKVEIVGSFIEFLKEHGRRPKSLSELCADNELEWKEVKKRYKTLRNLEKQVWLRWFQETIAILESSEEYRNYSAREQLLAFYFTWLETIKPFRAFIKKAPTIPGTFSIVDWFLEKMKREFDNFSKGITSTAIINEEIVKRPFLDKLYYQSMWAQFLFIMNFWIKDTSEEQTKTDEAIERAVNLFFELAGRTQIDALIDFGKFLLKKER